MRRPRGFIEWAERQHADEKRARRRYLINLLEKLGYKLMPWTPPRAAKPMPIPDGNPIQGDHVIIVIDEAWNIDGGPGWAELAEKLKTIQKDDTKG